MPCQLPHAIISSRCFIIDNIYFIDDAITPMPIAADDTLMSADASMPLSHLIFAIDAFAASSAADDDAIH